MKVDMMDWELSYRYKILGSKPQPRMMRVPLFDPTSSTEVYQRIVKEGAKPKTSRTPVFPAEWQNHLASPLKSNLQ